MRGILPISVTRINNCVFKVFQLPGVFNFEVTDAGTAEGFKACAVAEFSAEVVGQAADVSAFAAGDLEVDFGETVEVQLEVGDMDVAGFEFDFLVGTGVVESAFPFDFDG